LNLRAKSCFWISSGVRFDMDALPALTYRKV
jgi:hypothetical protein